MAGHDRGRSGKNALALILRETLEECRSQGTLSGSETPPIILETPKHEGQGDFATTLALSLAKIEKKAPRQIAQILVSELEGVCSWIDQVEIAGPGYINFFLSADYWLQTLLDIHDQGAHFGRYSSPEKQKIQIEFVSANPTGPLHVASGRAAALGDALARLLEAVGHEVDREYYLNDVGAQMTLLGRSTYLRYRALFGEEITLPEGSYQGKYIIEIAEAIQKIHGGQYLKGSEKEHLPFFIRYSFETIVSWIKKDISDFGVDFNHWFSEKALHEKKEVSGVSDISEVSKALGVLKSKKMLYEKEGATWLATTQFGDDKDRVLIRSNGALTYFASDIAYHRNKFERFYDRLIDIWGADHHGYVPRVKAATVAMGYKPEGLTVLIHQLVNLLRDGKAVKMSKRAGSFVTLREVMDEVGVDATRFFFLMRRADTTLDFDLELAKKASSENPVYYVQYAYARLCSIVRVAEGKGTDVGTVIRETEIEDLALLSLPEEQALIKQLAHYPDLIRSAADALEPHRITFYLQTLAGMLHRYYFNCRIITEFETQTKARLVLITAIRIVLKNGLDILGISAPERM